MLKNIRVAEFALNVAGPYCGMMLADLGADVVKVERPGRGDTSRAWGTWADRKRSVMFLSANRNKRSLAMDIQKPEGLAAAKKLIATSDVVIESMSPGVAERLGIGFEAAKALRPDVIYVSVSGYGQVGPMAKEGGFDSMIQAYTGLMDMTGPEGAPPSRVPVSSLDYMTGCVAFGGVMAALLRREQLRAAGKTAPAQRVDASLYDAAINFLSPFLTEAAMTGRVQTRSGGELHYVYPYGVFATRDGHLSLGIGSDNLWRKFCPAFDVTPLMDDPRFARNEQRVANRAELRALLEPIFAGMTLEEALARTKAAGLPATPVRTIDANLVDEHMKIRQGLDYVDVSHPTPAKAPIAASPVRLTPPAGPGPAVAPPPLGADSLAVLEDLGYGPTEVRALMSQGIVAAEEAPARPAMEKV